MTDSSSFEEPEFLNIDLHVRSRRSLAPLAAAWPASYQPLIAEGRPNPRWLILYPPGIVNSAESAARQLLRRIRSLKGAPLQCWKQAHRRVFDIGIQAGGPGLPFEEVRLTPETLRQIGSLDAHIQVTVYAARPQPGSALPDPPERSLDRQ